MCIGYVHWYVHLKHYRLVPANPCDDPKLPPPTDSLIINYLKFMLSWSQKVKASFKRMNKIAELNFKLLNSSSVCFALLYTICQN